MDSIEFDLLTRRLIASSSRRGLMQVLASGGLAALIAWPLGAFDADAKKKRKKKRKPKKRKDKKPKPNAYGCLNVGAVCKSEDQCCSGICEGKKGKRKCRAHDVGTCDQDDPGICEAGNPLSALCNGKDCGCFRTTGGSNVCARLFDVSECADCQKDGDCMALGFPPGTACAPIAGNFECEGFCDSGMACVPPCDYEPPEPTE